MTVPQTQPESCRVDASGFLLQNPDLCEIEWLKHGCTLRHFSAPDALRGQELRHLQDVQGLPHYPIVYAQQKHTPNVGIVDANILAHQSTDGRFIFKQTDAIVCPFPRTTIAVFTADCAPIFFIDKQTRAVALAHAGWQGTLGRIAENVILAMVSVGSVRENIIVWIGPTIGGCCYEVSPELIDRFRSEFGDSYDESPYYDGRMLDLVTLNRMQLLAGGIPAGNILAGQPCTLHNRERFHSYRGDGGTTGRIISTMTVLSGADE